MFIMTQKIQNNFNQNSKSWKWKIKFYNIAKNILKKKVSF